MSSSQASVFYVSAQTSGDFSTNVLVLSIIYLTEDLNRLTNEYLQLVSSLTSGTGPIKLSPVHILEINLYKLLAS